MVDSSYDPSYDRNPNNVDKANRSSSSDSSYSPISHVAWSIDSSTGLPVLKTDYANGSFVSEKDKVNLANNQANLEIYNEERKYQRELADQERLLAEQRAYDSPEAQVARMRAAGLNPDLLGIDSGTSAVSAPTSGDNPTTSAAEGIRSDGLSRTLDFVAKGMSTAIAGFEGYVAYQSLANTVAATRQNIRQQQVQIDNETYNLIDKLFRSGVSADDLKTQFPNNSDFIDVISKGVAPTVGEVAKTNTGTDKVVADTNRIKANYDYTVAKGLFTTDRALKQIQFSNDELELKRNQTLYGLNLVEHEQTWLGLEDKRRSLENQLIQASINEKNSIVDRNDAETERTRLLSEYQEYCNTQMECTVAYLQQLKEGMLSDDPVTRIHSRNQFIKLSMDFNKGYFEEPLARTNNLNSQSELYDTQSDLNQTEIEINTETLPYQIEFFQIRNRSAKQANVRDWIDTCNKALGTWYYRRNAKEANAVKLVDAIMPG